MMNHISIDVTDAKECAVPQDKFRINKYSFSPETVFEDLVHKSEPYIHLQILRPEDDEQRDKAITYFKEHHKLYITFADRKEMLLYLGATQGAYIKSTVVPVEINELNNLLPQAAHWFRFYGNEE